MNTEASAVGVLKDSKEREVVHMKKKEWVLLSLPVLSILATGAVDLFVKRSLSQMKTPHPYLLYFLGICLVVYLAFGIASFFSSETKKKVLYMAPFYAMLAQLLDGLNLATAKFALLPVIYFPAPDRILQVFVKDANLLLSCIVYSYSLLAISWILGVSIGIATGAWLGFSKRADYWLWPFIKALGPIPPVAWIPLALVIFPTMYSGSVFLIFLSIWFPTASLTLAGIRNVNKSYFEVAETLGQPLGPGLPGGHPRRHARHFHGRVHRYLHELRSAGNGRNDGRQVWSWVVCKLAEGNDGLLQCVRRTHPDCRELLPFHGAHV